MEGEMMFKEKRIPNIKTVLESVKKEMLLEISAAADEIRFRAIEKMSDALILDAAKDVSTLDVLRIKFIAFNANAIAVKKDRNDVDQSKQVVVIIDDIDNAAYFYAACQIIIQYSTTIELHVHNGKISIKYQPDKIKNELLVMSRCKT